MRAGNLTERGEKADGRAAQCWQLPRAPLARLETARAYFQQLAVRFHKENGR